MPNFLIAFFLKKTLFAAYFFTTYNFKIFPMKKIHFLIVLLFCFTQCTWLNAQSCPPVKAFTSFDYNSMTNTLQASWLPSPSANSYEINLFLDNGLVQTYNTPNTDILIDLSPFGPFSEGYISVVSDCNPFETLISPVFTKEIVIDDVSMRTIIQNGCITKDAQLANVCVCICELLKKRYSKEYEKILKNGTSQDYEDIFKKLACELQQKCGVNIVKRYCSNASAIIGEPLLTFKTSATPNSVVTVTPNPSDFLFSLKWAMEKPETVSLFLYDSTGKLLETPLNEQLYSEGTQQQQLDLSAYPRGIYYYQLLHGQQQFSGKLIKLE